MDRYEYYFQVTYPADNLSYANVSSTIKTLFITSDHLKKILKAMTNPSFYESWTNFLLGDPTKGIVSIRSTIFSPANFGLDVKYVDGVDIPWGKDILLKEETYDDQAIEVEGFGYKEKEYVYNVSNFYDLFPYSKLELHIPALGRIPLDMSLFSVGDNFLYFTLYPDFNSGFMLLIVELRNSRILQRRQIFDTTFPLGRTIPIVRSDASERFSMNLDAARQSIASAVSIALPMIAPMSAPNTMTPYQYQGMIANSIAQATSNSNRIEPPTGGSVSGSGNDMLTELDFRIVLFEIRPNIRQITNYNHYYGKPLLQDYTLEDVHGFTVVEEIHLQQPPNSTLDEYNEIINLLYSGIILP